MKKILLFSPFQGIPEHSFLEKKLSELLHESGSYSIDVMTCEGFLKDFCTTMAAHRLTFLSNPEEKTKICEKCKSYRTELYGKNFSGKMFTVESKLKPEHHKILEDEKKKIELELQNYSYEGINLGRISSYEMILNHKLKGLTDLSPHIRDEYAVTILNNLKITLAMKNLLSHSDYEGVILYNGNYVVNNTVSNLVKKSFPKVRPILIHYGLNWARPRDKLFLINGRHQEHLRDRIAFYEKDPKAVDLSSYSKEELDEYLQALHSAQSVFIYSAAKSNDSSDIFSRLNLDPKKPTALVSVASMDEIYALQFAVFQTEHFDWVEMTFPDQMQWIEKTVEYFAKNPDWQMILRIHPREFPNKREKVLSKFAQFYQSMEKRLPPNVVLNTPEQKISIYDLFDVIHLHLTSWSSVGLESSLFGVPTIASTRGIGLYPCKYIHFFSKMPEEYFSQIGKVLSNPKLRDEEQIRRAKDWILYDFNHTCITFDTDHYWEKKPPFLRRLVNKFLFPVKLYSYKKYSKSVSMSEKEKAVALKFFSTNKDIFEIKSGL